MMKHAFAFFGIMIISYMVNATSITTPIFTEERTFKLAHDVIVGDVVDVVSIGDSRSNCLTGMIKLKVFRSFDGHFKDSQVVELGFTHSALLPKVGEKYFAVINTKSDNFYSDCRKPKFYKYKNRFASENIFLVYRADFAKVFGSDKGQRFEFNSCQEKIDFLFQSKLKESELSIWENDGKICRRLVGNYEELMSLILIAFPRV